jgi:cellulose synthase/poly-beta-1,6-N-acetylglucosamine synthase-like glycosyltransferase
MMDIIYGAFLGVFLLITGWIVYNLPILAAGVESLRKGKGMPKRSEKSMKMPFFSIIIPVKSEQRVIGRLLDALSRLTYRRDRFEVIIVEDGSDDETPAICSEYSQKKSLDLKILQKPFSDGKPSALNYGLKEARGDIVAIFDADSVPSPDILTNVRCYFDDSNVAAVQGRTLSVNSEQNMLTKFLSYEETAWCEAYLRGKDVLGLFVHLRGSCQFVRRTTLERVKGFDETVLAEDVDLSARLTERGYKIRYASDVQSWQESPAHVKQLLIQRVRWFRGTMEIAFKYGRLMAKPSRRSFDAEATLFGPFVLIASLLTYFASFFAMFAVAPVNTILQLSLNVAGLLLTVMLFLLALGLIYASKPRRISNILWLPFIYFYWSLQTFVALYAMLLIVFRRPRKWSKTEKNGAMDRALNLEGLNSGVS